ncbi:uncharacterized protein LOC144124494 isoform X2 [Amblyomma americanum]
MALCRLKWIVDSSGTLPPQQSGFRHMRSTADCLSDVVATLEQARALGEAAFLVLLDIKSAFDCLPHWAILDALDALSIGGHLLQFLQAFLRDRYLCVRVGQTTSSRHSVPCGVPQGSVLSPFLFNLVLAQLPPRARKRVRVAVYADDIAVFARTPTRRGRSVRSQVRQTLDAINDHLRSIGLALSPQKSEALMVHPTSAARRWTPPLHLDGTPLPWRKSVRYLGLTIDARLTRGPAVKELRSQSALIASLARRFLAKGSGCSPAFCLRIYEAAATAKALYALPLVGLSRAQWNAVDKVHRGAIGQFYGLPRNSPTAATYAVTRLWPVSLRAMLTALNHIERMQRSGTCGDLLAHFKAQTRSHMGAAVNQLYKLLGPPPRFPPPHQYRPPRIDAVLPGVRSKRSTPHCALRQEVASKVHQEFAGHTIVYTDGSVREEAAGAACIAPSLPAVRQLRLNTPASSLTAELAAISLAADVLAANPAVTRAAILTDSRASLQALHSPERGSRLLRIAALKLHLLGVRGCNISMQWIPSHIGVDGNEAADELARAALHPTVPLSRIVTPYDSARLALRRFVTRLHPDPRVASATAMTTIDTTRFARADYVLLLRLRTGSGWTHDRLRRHRDPPAALCAQCGSADTLEHILCVCPASSRERLALQQGPGPALQCAERGTLPGSASHQPDCRAPPPTAIHQQLRRTGTSTGSPGVSWIFYWQLVSSAAFPWANRGKFRDNL